MEAAPWVAGLSLPSSAPPSGPLQMVDKLMSATSPLTILPGQLCLWQCHFTGETGHSEPWAGQAQEGSRARQAEVSC